MLATPSTLLTGYILSQFGRGEHLLVIARYEEVAWLKRYSQSRAALPLGNELAVILEIAYHIVAHLPLIKCIPASQVSDVRRDASFLS